MKYICLYFILEHIIEIRIKCAQRSVQSYSKSTLLVGR